MSILGDRPERLQTAAALQDLLRERLIVFTRYPEPGMTKTRLVPTVGVEGATDLQRRMTEHAAAWVKKFKRSRPLSVEVCHEGGDGDRMRSWLGRDFAYRRQGSGDLGRRMAQAFGEAFQAGMARVVLMGTDCPGITDRLIQDAFESLGRSDVVLGPARDGGYYGIGLRRPVPELFADIPWGTERVLKGTEKVAKGLGLTVRLLEPLADVDRPEDLSVWEEASKRSPASSSWPWLSIVIPTLNEAKNIRTTLASTKGPEDVEVIVVDGGSRDETAEIARSFGAAVLISPPGRGRQMNLGGFAARGDVLLFLHGDTCLPRGYDQYVDEALSRARTVAGAFRLKIDGKQTGLRFIEQTANCRSRRLGLPYGDQGIFLGSGLFRCLGGFPEMPIMEDFEFMRRLRRLGRVVIVPASVLTSGRRWATLGVWRTTLTNYAVALSYAMGVSPGRLVRWYHEKPRSA